MRGGGDEQEAEIRVHNQTTGEVVPEDGGEIGEGGVEVLHPTEKDVTCVRRGCERTRDWGHTPSW